MQINTQSLSADARDYVDDIDIADAVNIVNFLL